MKFVLSLMLTFSVFSAYAANVETSAVGQVEEALCPFLDQSERGEGKKPELSFISNATVNSPESSNSGKAE